MKFLPHTTGSNRLMATYETVKTHIEQYVQKTYKHGQDIAKLLRELEKKDLTAEMQKRRMSMLTVERISLGSLWQSLKTTVANLTDPHVILCQLWYA